MPYDLDILVIGGGILGVSAAAVAAQKGYNVMLVRLHDQERPRADTLRNQGWLQSGMAYAWRFESDRRTGLVLAKMMYFWGRRMLVELGLPLANTDDRAIVRVATEKEASKLERDAVEIRIRNSVARLTDDDAQSKLGEFFEDGSIYFSLPDVRFDEAAVLDRLREIARDEGAELAESQDPISLIRDPASPCGVKCRLGPVALEARSIVLAAGAGNLPLFEQLNVSPPMTLRHTPLLVVRDGFSATAPIFIDRTRGFSFVRHPSRSPGQTGAMVVGTKVHREVGYCPAELREVSEEDVKGFHTCVPPILQDAIGPGRFTAGYEVIPRGPKAKSDLEPWVECVEGLPHVLAASPGRATLGLFAGRKVVTALDRLLGGPLQRLLQPRQRQTRKDRPPSPGMWTDSIFMHFEPQYHFNDAIVERKAQKWNVSLKEVPSPRR